MAIRHQSIALAILSSGKLCVLVSLIVLGCGRAESDLPVISPLELVSPTQLPDVWSHHSTETAIRLRNSSRFPVQIVELSTSCDCAVASVSDTDLSPGEIVEVRVSLQAVVPRTVGELRNISLFCKLKESKQSFTFQFRRRGIIAVDNQAVKVSQQISPGETFFVTLRVDAAFANCVKVICQNPDFQVLSQTVSAEGDAATVRLDIQARNQLAGATYRVPLVVQASQESQPIESTVYASVDVVVPVTLEPAAVRIDTSHGTSFESSLSVQTKSPVRSVSMMGATEVAAFESSKAPSGDWVLKWSVKPPVTEGLVVANCIVRIECEDGEAILKSVPVSVYTPYK
jgi:hypothetical protein